MAIPGQRKLFSLFKQPDAPKESCAAGCPPADAPNSEERLTPVADRVHNAEAMVLSFTAEHSLPFSKVPKLIALSKALANDKMSLDRLSMDRTSASYKMTHGLAKTYKDRLISVLQETKFSLNVDEATSANNHRILAVIVSFFCPVQQKVVIHHLTSVSVIKVDSDSLFNSIDKIFRDKNIPWENLMSVLMDSCAVMRGSKNGLETKIRKKRANHLLDIDGDTCHHAQIAAKKFCQPFEYHLEGLMSDLHSEFKWSVDHREVLQTICHVLGDVKYTVPQRWLSVYDVCVDTIRLFDAYTLFFAEYLTGPDADLYRDVVEDIYQTHKVTHENKRALKKLFQPLLQKTLTKEGKSRKTRIIEKLFYHRTKTMLIMQVTLLR